MQKTGRIKPEFEKFMKCIFSGQQLKAAGQMIPSSESQNCSASGYSSRPCEAEKQPDTGNLEEAEWSLRESSSLNYEEARALLGRIEYQKGNIEAALHVFEGIDIAAATPKMKITLASKRGERHKRHSKNFASPPMSNRAVSLLLEAIFLKAKSLQVLGRFKEAAQACKVILDIIESSLPEGFPENLGADCKLQETVSKAVELLPELWKLADSPREAVLSYRRALLHHWNLDTETTAKIQKEFAVFLLYFGGETIPPNLRTLMDISFVPRNNIEEAILLLMILLRKVSLKRIVWDPSILDHLSFALSISGDLRSLANKVEELPPGTISRKEMYYILAFCYHGAGEDAVALNLLRKLLSSVEDPRCVSALLLASKVCAENPDLAEEGTSFACRALECLEGECDQLESTANCLLGISLSAQCKLTITDSERITKQSKALKVLESTGRSTGMRDPNILYHLSLENAEQRKLDAALYYAKSFLKLDGGSNVKGWLLMARILSAQRRFADAESIISAALDQSGKWDQGNLLRTKAKLQIAQGQVKTAIETYTQLLAVLQVQSKTFSSGRKLHKGCENPASSLELDVWHDLAFVYISLSQWRDAEVCLSKSKAIGSFSATRCYATGVLYQRKGLHKEALQAFGSALDIDPTHVPSLISTALVLKKLSEKSNAVIRSFLMAALRLDRMNPFAWYNLGLVYKSEGTKCSALEAAECFQVAATLEESAPVEPFR
ncbi:protein NPGR2 isoform X1 [Mangifera indica]|uniref:protein NPGR2 isoform X1 n=2 Tax=Mangifera indica TaxID=29780 RepID=UPI001CFA25BE|nr:protein NPGR2 isoform X1 [Mangifera indica]XP_044493923.1 protein NPGR2 isoform X1 [Mangifera indica]XP_044493924.1 protein NPGR2 isoform X1 [Mangifera indica]XP_044493925.1 protein NPGR2 isoform X1 [Mangifera indica]